MKCPCGTNQEFSQCCEPYLERKSFPDTAEKLMRSRYVAYVMANIDYLETTLAPESRHDFNAKELKQWAQQAKWKGLKILATTKGAANDSVGTVEFVATYTDGKQGLDHHEVSEFRKADDDHWYFVDGEGHTHKEGEGHQHHHEKVKQVVREQPKIGRNDPCVCGSGKKYKKCCGTDA